MPNPSTPPPLPGTAFLCALRAWYDGAGARDAILRYCPQALDGSHSARGAIGRIRRQVAGFALTRHRADLAEPFQCMDGERTRHRGAAMRALDLLPLVPVPQPLVSDAVETWLQPRVIPVLHRHGIRTLADLTVRVPRRRRWWVAIPGLGERSARRIEAFFVAHPALTERARALVVMAAGSPVTPWESIRVPHDVDGSSGIFRAPKRLCALEADNDWQAINAWLERHEAAETRRAYRREAERLLLWAIVERGKALSSLASEDAPAYRAFLRHPAPRVRWVGPAQPRSFPGWRPFTGAMSPDTIAYALSVLRAMFRWLIAQRYVLANPFADLKVRGRSVSANWTSRAPSRPANGSLSVPSPMASSGRMAGRRRLPSACAFSSISVMQRVCARPSWSASHSVTFTTAHTVSGGCISPAKVRKVARLCCHRSRALRSTST